MLSAWLLSALLPIALVRASVFDRSPAATFGTSVCSTTGLQTSCHNTTVQSDLCCFEAPQGLLVQTQFWDLSGPGVNLPNNWTIHGLFPDNCDTTFTTNCDPSRAVSSVTTILQNAGETALLNFMSTFWVDINGNNEQFWEHEWVTHGTCLSTLTPQCLPTGSPSGTDVVDFFLSVTNLYQTLPTFNLLASQGITPSSTQTFTLSQLTTALKAASGFTPALNCNGAAINQISWYFNLQGSVIDGTFVPIDAPTPGTCGSSGLTYPPKPGSITSTTPVSSTTTTPVSTTTSVPSTTSSSATGTATTAPGPLPTKAIITNLMSSGSMVGGVLTSGTWSVQTPATFTITPSGTGFTLTTRKGTCAVSNSQFECGTGATPSVFGSALSGSTLLLTFDGSTAFSATTVPSGIAQIPIFADSSNAQIFSLVMNPV